MLFGVCRPGTWRERCGNLNCEKKLYGGLWAPGVEDRPDKLPHKRGRGERLRIIFGVSSHAVAAVQQHRAPKGPLSMQS